MLHFKNGTIKLTRGDTARITVKITNETTGGDYTVASGDTLTLSVKKAITDGEPCLQKVLTGTATFHIEPKDTANMAYGKYKYDVELKTVEGDVYTVIESSPFELTWEVT